MQASVLIEIVQLILNSVVAPLIAKFRAENPDPNATDASAIAGLESALGRLGDSIADLRAASAQ